MYGHIYDLISGYKLGSFTIGDHKYLMTVWLVLIIAGSITIIKNRSKFINLNQILNVIAIILIILPLINIITYHIGNRNTWTKINNIGEKNKISKSGSTSTEKRDIYLIILDGYANNSTLKELYRFENKKFINYLKEKNFFIAEKSRSNYALSYLSIASSLNMKYLNYLSDKIGEDSKNRQVSYKLSRDNNILNFLESKGYRSIHFNSGWRETNDNPYADINIKTGRGNEFIVLLIQTSMLSYFENNLIRHDARKRVLGTFEKLAKVKKIKGPKFIFAHILVPHPPYLFDEDGQTVPEARLKKSGKVWEHRQNYINQLKFVNEKVENLVDEIISGSKTEPIIVIQSDHGSASLISHNDYVGWNNPSNEMLKERFRNLIICYLPDSGQNKMYDSITSVNVFRVIFNTYFNEDFKLLNDKSYFSTYESPYKFVDVTTKVIYD